MSTLKPSCSSVCRVYSPTRSQLAPYGNASSRKVRCPTSTPDSLISARAFLML
ncbi:Uncharacterised protein [Bordetella pertussis]|nr:Uncharacterised protein [Bordetella pertussis]